jgi:hypothetical protein
MILPEHIACLCATNYDFRSISQEKCPCLYLIQNKQDTRQMKCNNQCGHFKKIYSFV